MEVDRMSVYTNYNPDLYGFEFALDDLIFSKDSVKKGEKPTGNTALIIAIYAPWGSGKTFFINHYAKHLESKNNTIPIVFNAWENDYFDPIVGLIGHLADKIEDSGQKKLGDAIENFMQTLVPTLVKSGTACAPGSKEIIEDFKTRKSKSYKELIDLYKKNKSRVEELKKVISELEIKNHGSSSSTKKKSSSITKKVIMIDELDRCRPDYAIHFLEICKHFFNAENTVFIFSLDQNSIWSMIRKLYGNEFEAEYYLSRFFDLEYYLPVGDNFISEIIEYNEKEVIGFQYLKEPFQDSAKCLKMSPRGILKVMDEWELFKDEYLACVFIPLLALKHKNKRSFINLEESPKELPLYGNSLKNIFEAFKIDDDSHPYKQCSGDFIDSSLLPLSLLLFEYRLDLWDPKNTLDRSKILNDARDNFIILRDYLQRYIKDYDSSDTINIRDAIVLPHQCSLGSSFADDGLNFRRLYKAIRYLGDHSEEEKE